MDRSFAKCFALGLTAWIALAVVAVQHGYCPASALQTLSRLTGTTHGAERQLATLVRPNIPPAPPDQFVVDSSQLPQFVELQQHEAALQRVEFRKMQHAQRQLVRMHMMKQHIVIDDAHGPRTIEIMVPQVDKTGQ